MTGSGSSCRRSACSRSRRAGSALLDRWVGPGLKLAVAGGDSRGGCQHRGDDARAALLLQPRGGRIYRGRAASVWSRRTTGMHSVRTPANGSPSTRHRAENDPVRRHFPTPGSTCAGSEQLPDRLVPDRSRTTEMVCASKPAGGLFPPRPVTRRAGPASLYGHEAGRSLDLDLSVQRGSATSDRHRRQ